MAYQYWKTLQRDTIEKRTKQILEEHHFAEDNATSHDNLEAAYRGLHQITGHSNDNGDDETVIPQMELSQLSVQKLTTCQA